LGNFFGDRSAVESAFANRNMAPPSVLVDSAIYFSKHKLVFARLKPIVRQLTTMLTGGFRGAVVEIAPQAAVDTIVLESTNEE
jgi:hypothetical protein